MNTNTNITTETEALQIPVTEIKEVTNSLETYFASIQLPQDVHLNKHTYIFDVGLFIRTHLQFVRSNENKGVYLPYLLRLVELEKLLRKGNHKGAN